MIIAVINRDKKVIYSLRINKDLLDRIKAKAEEQKLQVSTFAKKCLLKNLDEDNKLESLERRIKVLESINIPNIRIN